MHRVEPLEHPEPQAPASNLIGSIWERAAAYHSWPEELLALLRLLDALEATITSDTARVELDPEFAMALFDVARTSVINDLDPPSMAHWTEFQDALKQARCAREVMRAVAMQRNPHAVLPR